jgi:hypothetical protein
VRRGWMVAGLALATLLATTISEAGNGGDSLRSTGVTLYELSERVSFDPDTSVSGVIRRNATAALQGFATSLCPSQLLISVPRIESCTVIATGTDSVSTATGVGQRARQQLRARPRSAGHQRHVQRGD